MFWALTDVLGGSEPVTWLAACAAAFAASALSHSAVTVVVAFYEGGLRLRTSSRAAVTGQAASPLAVTLALIGVITVSASPAGAWLLAAFGGLLLVAYRAYGALADRHLNLERLYRFSQAVSTSPEADEVMSGLLGQARELLRAERASAAFVTSDGGIVARVRLGASGRLTRSEDPPTAEDAWVLRQVVTGGTPLLMARGTRDPEARRWLAAYGMRDAVVVPLRGKAGVVGALVVADRLGDIRTFDKDDVLLLETVANQASVALRNGELMGQLRHEALHDALTGLPNREHLRRRLATALDDVVAGRAEGAAVMILDLDDFKEVNETLGHQEGDLPPGRGRGAAGRHRREGRHGGPARRRRVRRPAAGHRRRVAGAAHRPADPAGPRAADRPRRPGDRGDRLARDRPRPGPRRRPGRAAQAGRHRDVRRQDLHPGPAALRARARHRPPPPDHPGLRAAVRAAERRDRGARAAPAPDRARAP